MNNAHPPTCQIEENLLHSILDEFLLSFFGSSFGSNNKHAELLTASSKFLDYISLIYEGEIFAHGGQTCNRQNGNTCDPVRIFEHLLLMPSSSLFASQPALSLKLLSTLKQTAQGMYLYKGFSFMANILNSIFDAQLEICKLLKRGTFPSYVFGSTKFKLESFAGGERLLVFLDQFSSWCIRLFSSLPKSLEKLLIYVMYRVSSNVPLTKVASPFLMMFIGVCTLGSIFI